jgi:hypothetical protein
MYILLGPLPFEIEWGFSFVGSFDHMIEIFTKITNDSVTTSFVDFFSVHSNLLVLHSSSVYNILSGSPSFMFFGRHLDKLVIMHPYSYIQVKGFSFQVLQCECNEKASSGYSVLLHALSLDTKTVCT